MFSAFSRCRRFPFQSLVATSHPYHCRSVALKYHLWVRKSGLHRLSLPSSGTKATARRYKTFLSIAIATSSVLAVTAYVRKPIQPTLRNAPNDVLEDLAFPEPRVPLSNGILRIWNVLDAYIFEPLLVLTRGLYLCIVLLPIGLCAPMAFFGALDSSRDYEPSGRLLWFRLIRRQFERAGATFVKLGQWAATRSDLFPTQLCLELSKLHSQNRPHSFHATKEAVETALSLAYRRPMRLEDVFSEFPHEPVGVGAIAQVYKARIHPSIQLSFAGEPLDSLDRPKWVAIKVLHPNVEVTIRRDLQILQFFTQALDKIPTLHWLSLPEEIGSFSEVMMKQLDLRCEAVNLVRFKDGFRYRYNVRFPRAVRGVGSREVLLEEFVEAVPMSAFVSCKRGTVVGRDAVNHFEGDDAGLDAMLESQVHSVTKPGTIFDRRISGIGLNAFLNMLILDNFVHCDLHPGNIMVTFSRKESIISRLKSSIVSFLDGRSTRMDEPIRPVPDVGVARRLVRAMESIPRDCSAFQRELIRLYQKGFTPQLVILDTGLVSELSENDRRNFLDLFRAIAGMEGYQAGELFISRSADPSTVIRPDVFCRQMESLLLRIRAKSMALSKVQIAGVLSEALSMFRDHHVKMSGEFANVIVSIMILEGLGRELDPDLDLLRVALPLLREVGRQGGGRGMLKEVSPGKDVGLLVKMWIWFEAWEWINDVWEGMGETHPSLLYAPDV